MPTPNPKTIRSAGTLHFLRSEQFQLKGVVSKFIENLIERSVKNATKHIKWTECATFCYGELQMHSVIVPALAELTKYFVLEYPIRRGCNKDDKSGRVDYYCVNNHGQRNEYHLFIELKCGQQGIPIRGGFRKRNIDLWQEANKQLAGIPKEISLYKNHLYKNVMRVCIEIIPLYANTAKSETINDETLQDAFQIAVKALQGKNQPNLSVLWKFHPRLQVIANGDLCDNRQFWGMLFLCRILPPI